MTYEEVVLFRMIELNQLMPHYWSELFLMSFQLFDPLSEEYKELQQMIEGVEMMIFTPEEIELGLSLYDIEMAIESNPDYFAYFERSDNPNITISKFDIERKLNQIKMWLYSHVRARAITRKFRKYR
jgi:hypothetical protein